MITQTMSQSRDASYQQRRAGRASAALERRNADTDDAADKASAILATPDAILDYLLAGRAILTIVNRATGGRFTFKINRAEQKRPDDPPTWFVAALTEKDNTGDYQYLGFIRAGRYLPNLLKVKADAPTQKAATWLLPRMLAKHPLPDTVDVLHSGRCGRTLTTPDSIERGLGPECASKVA